MDENKILTTGDANKLLYRFLKWKQSYLVLRPHDMAFLLVYVHFQAMTGYTEENWPTWSLFQQPKDGLGGEKKKQEWESQGEIGIGHDRISKVELKITLHIHCN